MKLYSRCSLLLHFSYMWLVQRIVPQGVASLTQQLMPIVMVFVIGGGGGVHSTLPSVQHWQKWYLLRYKH